MAFLTSRSTAAEPPRLPQPMPYPGDGRTLEPLNFRRRRESRLASGFAGGIKSSIRKRMPVSIRKRMRCGSIVMVIAYETVGVAKWTFIQVLHGVVIESASMRQFCPCIRKRMPSKEYHIIIKGVHASYAHSKAEVVQRDNGRRPKRRNSDEPDP